MMLQNPNCGLGRLMIDLANVVRIDDAELYFYQCILDLRCMIGLPC